ncbi:hypothetical protein GGS20DRAFT_584824 [Poronia punctata]|nr:hypothetical protein GGS20DRAFT_584824 [Poronia punctata]
MMRILGIILALAYLSCADNDLEEVISLYTTHNATIIKASATLTLPVAPEVITGALALWSGILLDKDFIQGVSENSPDGLGYCTGLGGNWCNIPYALTPNITSGEPIVAPAGMKVRTEYVFNPVTTMWDQTIFVNGFLTSNISTSKGQKGNVFYISMECAGGICPPAPAHTWEDISITLNKANPAFDRGWNWSHGATGGKMSSPDGGRTWSLSTLHVPTTPISLPGHTRS